MNPQQSPLDEILETYGYKVKGDPLGQTALDEYPGFDVYGFREAKEAIRALFLSIVGDDYLECPPECTPTMHDRMEGANAEKAELRERIKEL
jgi:hypothetical protein